MKHTWFKWLFLCTLATFSYNLFGVITVVSQTALQANGFLIGAFILFIGFVTAFYWLDNWLSRHQDTDFSTYFLPMVKTKILLMIMGLIIMILTKGEVFYRVLFLDIAITNAVTDVWRSHGREILHAIIPKPEYYALAKNGILVAIFLLVEMVFLTVSTLAVRKLEKRH